MLGGIGALAVILLRAILTPTLRDPETGRFLPGWGIIALMLIITAALVLLARRVEPRRVDIHGKAVAPLSVICLLTGAVLGLNGLWGVFNGLLYGFGATTRMATLLSVLTVAFSLLAGVSLISWGLQISSEAGTRIGMISWSGLAPVLWMWVRLTGYEMSYASAVHLSDGFYDFAMFIAELLFLFKLARFASGIGNTRPGSLMAYASATALFALSAPAVRLCLYLMGDTEAYLASGVASLPDFMIGALALCFAWGLRVSAATEDQLSAPDSSGSSSNSAAPASETVSSPEEDSSSSQESQA